jgi:hypothetical protein
VHLNLNGDSVSVAVTLAAGSHLILDLRDVGYTTGQTVNSGVVNSKGEPLSPRSPGQDDAQFTLFQMRRFSANSNMNPGERIRLVSPGYWQERVHEDRCACKVMASD